MHETLQLRIDKYRKLPVSGLRAKYEKVFGEPPRSRNKDFLFRRIAWRMQANRYGDLSDQTHQRALAIANNRDLRLRKPREHLANKAERVLRSHIHGAADLRLPLPGTVLTRSFKGRTVNVCVLADGFRYEDRRFRSLSGVAQHITGTRWNGYVFWGLQGRRSAQRG